MLENTFLQIPGIGITTEKRLWKSGIKSWDLFLNHRKTDIPSKKLDIISEYVKESKYQMASSNPNYFVKRIPVGHHWRLFPEFRNSTAYLDIETTGMSHYYESITTVSLYDGKSIFCYVKDQNLEDFSDDIRQYKVIITYNGKCFDVPFIEKYFGIRLNHAHIDLRYLLASLGYKGGLKSCETQLGINRGDLTDIDGFFAVLLWHDYLNNRNEKALETLLAYNIQDVLTLEVLMVISYNLKIKDTPFYKNRLPEPVSPESPFRADMETINRIRSQQFNFGFS